MFLNFNAKNQKEWIYFVREIVVVNNGNNVIKIIKLKV